MADLIIWNSYLTDSPDSKKVSNSTIVRIAGPHELACWLEKFGYSVKVIDFCNKMSSEDVIKITEKHIDSNTIAIGASSTFWNWTPQHIFGEPDMPHRPTYVELGEGELRICFILFFVLKPNKIFYYI